MGREGIGRIFLGAFIFWGLNHGGCCFFQCLINFSRCIDLVMWVMKWVGKESVEFFVKCWKLWIFFGN